MSAEQALFGMSVLGALNYLFDVHSAPRVARTVTKTSAIASLTILSLSLGAPLRLVGALSFSAVGDAFLASHDGETAFLCGLASFLLAHGFYIGAFVEVHAGDLDSAAEILSESSWRMGVAFGALVVALVMSIVLLPRVSHNLQLPVTVYVTVIAAMMLMAATVRERSVVSGAVAFCTSDVVLALDRFVLRRDSKLRKTAGRIVWVLYYVGQLLIVQGMTDLESILKPKTAA